MAPRSEDPKLIICVIDFELVQPICSAYIKVTDGRTDGRLTIAIPHFALRASRGKSEGASTSEHPCSGLPKREWRKIGE